MMAAVTLARRRLRAQRLAGAAFADARQAVQAFGAVQAQDYWAARWALGERVDGLAGAEVDRLLDAGVILRTHVLRPTWHLVLPEDAAWLLALTGPRVLRGIAGRHRRLGLDEATIERASAAFAKAVAGGRHRTRAELAAVLLAEGISPEGQRLPHLLLCAELDRVLISGARRGGQMTWALFSERVPDPPALEPEPAAAELARRYFGSHGPARLADFTWWSGLTLTAARRAIAAAGNLEREEIDGVEHWSDPATAGRPAPAGTAHLLPSFDEYLVAYRHREAAHHPEGHFDPALFAFGSILSSVVLVDGRLRAGWRRVPGRTDPVEIEVRELTRLDEAEWAALERARARLEGFLESPVILSRVS